MLTVPSSDNRSNASRDRASAGLALVGTRVTQQRQPMCASVKELNVQQVCSVFIVSSDKFLKNHLGQYDRNNLQESYDLVLSVTLPMLDDVAVDAQPE